MKKDVLISAYTNVILVEGASGASSASRELNLLHSRYSTR